MKRLIELRDHKKVHAIYFRHSSELGSEGARMVLGVWRFSKKGNGTECRTFFGDRLEDFETMIDGAFLFADGKLNAVDEHESDNKKQVESVEDLF